MRLVWFLIPLIIVGCGGSGDYDPQPKVQDFCEREPEHRLCEVQQINQAGNARFRLHADEHDVWQTKNDLGDCEDYALWKYQRLYDAGLSPNIRIYARQVAGFDSLHAVATVEVDGTTWILDNEKSHIRKLGMAERRKAIVL